MRVEGLALRTTCASSHLLVFLLKVMKSTLKWGFPEIGALFWGILTRGFYYFASGCFLFGEVPKSVPV